MVDQVPGSICEAGSDANHKALEDLRVVLGQLGCTVAKKRVSEGTLRVYLHDMHRYPLLNPRFCQDPLPGQSSHDSLEIRVLSKGDDAIDAALNTYTSTTDCAFFREGAKQGDYWDHGRFVLPLPFQVPDRRDINFVALGDTLSGLLGHLRTAI